MTPQISSGDQEGPQPLLVQQASDGMSYTSTLTAPIVAPRLARPVGLAGVYPEGYASSNLAARPML
jgi:hypothetical protein